jgi:uncharacterized protein (DUF2267 family)
MVIVDYYLTSKIRSIMHNHFEHHAQKGQEFLNKLALRLGDESNKDKAMRILRRVFHILRQRLTPEESMQMIAQLPMALKGLYVDGWKLHHRKSKMKTIEQFAMEVVIADREAAWGDFYGEEEVFVAIRAVLETLADYVSPGEIEDMISVMPADLKQVMEAWTMRYK